MSETTTKALDQQVIAITGASSGIGLCTALLAAERGAKVVLIARSDETLADAVAVIEERGGHALAVHCDVSSRDAVDSAVLQAIGAFGRIDTWINNAGVSIYGRLVDVSEEDSRRLFDVNFWGVVNGSLAALPALQASGGTLINVGSEVSEAVVPLQGMYSASKHAVKGFTDALRVELEHVEKAPVQVVLIQPTAVHTPFPEHARNYMDWEPKLPDPRITPQQVAEAILQAAVEGGRDIKVGAMATMNTMMSTLLPALGDRLAARQAGNQQKNIPPQRPAGTLYDAGGEGRIAGKP
jgi:short-subunit dehydrogenase